MNKDFYFMSNCLLIALYCSLRLVCWCQHNLDSHRHELPRPVVLHTILQEKDRHDSDGIPGDEGVVISGYSQLVYTGIFCCGKVVAISYFL